MNANVYVVIDPCSVCSFVKFMSKAEETSTLSTSLVSLEQDCIFQDPI